MTEFPHPIPFTFATPGDAYEKFYSWLIETLNGTRRLPTLEEFQNEIQKIPNWSPSVALPPDRVIALCPKGFVHGGTPWGSTRAILSSCRNLWVLFWVLGCWDIVSFLTRYHGTVLTSLIGEPGSKHEKPIAMYLGNDKPLLGTDKSMHHEKFIELISATPQTANILWRSQTPLLMLTRRPFLIERYKKSDHLFATAVALIKAGGKLLPWPFSPSHPQLLRKRQAEAQFHLTGESYLGVRELRMLVLSYAVDFVWSLYVRCPESDAFPSPEFLIDSRSYQDLLYKFLARACAVAFSGGRTPLRRSGRQKRKLQRS